jgi:hypothetical protein
MNYTKRYVVYETTFSSQNHHRGVIKEGLVKVDFIGEQINKFATEQEAIDACIADGLLFRNLFIIPQIYITT